LGGSRVNQNPLLLDISLKYSAHYQTNLLLHNLHANDIFKEQEEANEKVYSLMMMYHNSHIGAVLGMVCSGASTVLRSGTKDPCLVAERSRVINELVMCSKKFAFSFCLLLFLYFISLR